MTDGQLAALLSVLSAIGASLVAVVKWSVSRVTLSLDNNTAAHLASVEKMTEVSTKMDFVYQASREVRDFVTEERSGVHNTPIPPSDDTVTPIENPRKRVESPAKGTTYFHKRQPTKG